MKHILITGVSTGIGLDLARHLIDNGYFVFGSVRNPKDAELLGRELGKTFHPLIFDVTHDRSIKKAYQEVADRLGGSGLFALVNNAGIAVSGPLKHVSPENLSNQLDVNVTGCLRVTQTFLPLLGGELHSAYPPGRIINISSISGIIANPFMGPYAASKHAMEALSDSLRRELFIYGIKVIVIQPGIIRTNIWTKAKSEKYDFGPTDYDKYLERRVKIIEGMEKRALPASQVSSTIFKALESKHPRTRYIVARKAWLIWLFAYLIPDKILDRLTLRNLKDDNIRAT